MKTAALTVALIVALHAAAGAQPSAEDLYAEGQAAYDRADYKAAAGKWQASYELSKENALLFNVAQALRLSGDCRGAIAGYRRFVAGDSDPTSEQHRLADDLVRELEGKCPAPKVDVVPAPVSPQYQPNPGAGLNLPAGLNDRESGQGRPGRSWKIAGIATGGVGIAALAIGLGLGRHGAAIGDEVTDACRVSCDWATLKDKEARGKREVAIGKALDAVGVAAIAGGAVFYYLGVRREALTVAPARGGGGVVSWSGSW